MFVRVSVALLIGRLWTQIARNQAARATLMPLSSRLLLLGLGLSSVLLAESFSISLARLHN